MSSLFTDVQRVKQNEEIMLRAQTFFFARQGQVQMGVPTAEFRRQQAEFKAQAQNSDSQSKQLLARPCIVEALEQYKREFKL